MKSLGFSFIVLGLDVAQYFQIFFLNTPFPFWWHRFLLGPGKDGHGWQGSVSLWSCPWNEFGSAAVSDGWAGGRAPSAGRRAATALQAWGTLGSDGLAVAQAW